MKAGDIQLKPKHSINKSLEKLNCEIDIAPNGYLKFGVNFFTYEWILLSAIDFGEIQSTDLKKNLLSRSISELGRNKKLNSDNLIAELNKQKVQILKDKKTYSLLTTISATGIPIRRIKVGSSIVIIHGKYFPKKYRLKRKEFLRDHRIEEANPNYTKVSVTTDSKNPQQGFEMMLKDLEVLRSLINLLVNSTIIYRWGKDNFEPLNRVCFSEIFTLHNSTGECEKNYWYIEDFHEPSIYSFTEKDIKNVKTNIRLFIKRYNQCKHEHREVIKEGLNLYVSAFDLRNRYSSFLKAWTSLEIFLGSYKNEEIMKRSLSMFDPKSKEFQKEIMLGLIKYRNENVHSAENGHDPIVACSLIQYLIKHLVYKFHLKYAGFFKTNSEAMSFLDKYGTDLKIIKRESAIINRIIKRKEKITGKKDGI